MKSAPLIVITTPDFTFEALTACVEPLPFLEPAAFGLAGFPLPDFLPLNVRVDVATLWLFAAACQAAALGRSATIATADS